MIERLFPEDYPFGEPEYSKASEQIHKLQQSIGQRLDDDGKQDLEQLADAYLRQSNLAVRSAFTEGFRIAIELMLDVKRKPS